MSSAARWLHRRNSPQRTMVMSIPEALPTNTYQRLLHEQLERHGLTVMSDSRFEVRWLRGHPGRHTILHFHWQEFAYRPTMRVDDRRSVVDAWRAVARFGVRLAVARGLGYRVVWTVHQVIPHESHGRSDRLAAALLAGASHKLIVHDEQTAVSCRWLPVRAKNIAFVPHASYAETYPPGRGRLDRRRGLRLTWARFVFLAFGRIRAYKDLSLLLSAFAETIDELPDVALVIAGVPADKAVAAEIEQAAETDQRVRALLGFVPDDEVAELFEAADAGVFPRGDGGTAGSLVLCLSLGRPVVAARKPAYEALVGDEAAGWLFTPGDRRPLAATLIRAADPVVATARGRQALERMAGRGWPEVGARTAELLR